MFKKVLIANRGLIAANCVRAVKELGMKAIIAYDEADAESAAVRNADAAYVLKPSPDHYRPYLDINQIVDLASDLEVDAVHPGYGFLAQNKEFAQALKDRGIAFIAPKSEGIFDFANKHIIKAYAARAGLPILPGSESFVEREWLFRFAEAIQYPLVIKSVYGYGGVGMKVVHSEEELESSFNEVRHLCSRHLKCCTDVFLEKYLPGAQHVEFPVLRDANGTTIVLPEQECSVQRRFQKLVIETPSPRLSPQMRSRLESEIRVLANRLEVFGFATVEFLVKDGHAYFLEINGYIQPSHTATTLLTGVDLLKEQINILSGGALSVDPGLINRHGHVVGSFIYAEDPEKEFEPSPGNIERLHLPFGEEVYVQSNIFSGAVVSPLYDPMIAKLMVRGLTREEALHKLSIALSEFFVEGVKTNIPLMRALISSPEYAEGKVTPTYLDKPDQRRQLLEQVKTDEEQEIASLVAALSLYRDGEEELLVDQLNTDGSELGAASRWVNRRRKNV